MRNKTLLNKYLLIESSCQDSPPTPVGGGSNQVCGRQCGKVMRDLQFKYAYSSCVICILLQQTVPSQQSAFVCLKWYRSPEGFHFFISLFFPTSTLCMYQIRMWGVYTLWVNWVEPRLHLEGQGKVAWLRLWFFSQVIVAWVCRCPQTQLLTPTWLCSSHLQCHHHCVP